MKKAGFIFSISISVVALVISIYILLSKSKIGYISTSQLIEQFDGTKEASLELDEKKTEMVSGIDTLKKVIELEYSLYNAEKELLSVEDRKVVEMKLYNLQQAFSEKSKSIEESLFQEENTLTQGVLTQINSFLKKYGNENNYSLILGSNMEGSVLYGDEIYDITEEVIDELNKYYSGNE